MNILNDYRTLQNHYQHYKSHSEEYRAQRMLKSLSKKFSGPVRQRPPKRRKTSQKILKLEKKRKEEKVEESLWPEIKRSEIEEERFPRERMELKGENGEEMESSSIPPMELELETRGSIESSSSSPKHQIEFEVETIYQDDLGDSSVLPIVSHSLPLFPSSTLPLTHMDTHIQTYIENGETIIIVNNLNF